MIIDILRRAEANVTVASVEKQLLINACHGVNIVADAFINDCANTTFDLIALPVCLSTIFLFFRHSFISAYICTTYLVFHLFTHLLVCFPSHN